MDLKYNQRVIVQDLNKFWVNGEEFDGITYQGLLSVNTKTYVEEPTRSNDGSIPNIEDHDTFFVPQVKFSLKYFSIGDYQRLCRAVNSSNEFPVRYWDKQFGDFRTYMMYMKPEEMHKLYNVRTSVFGVLDYELEFVGTLNDLTSYSVTYLSKWWDGSDLVELTSNTTPYSSTTTYARGQIVYWNGEYYQAIYYENAFSNVAPPNTEYWQVITPTLWNSASTYSLGDVVYQITENGYVYYEAIKDGFSGYSLNNTTYWKSITVDAYSSSKTYGEGEYCTSNDVIYKAIYYKDTFSNQSPDNTQYWAKIYSQINVAEQVEWGNSIKVLTSTDLTNFYNIPSGKIFVGWNTRADGQGFSLKPNANFSVFEDMQIYPIFGDEE